MAKQLSSLGAYLPLTLVIGVDKVIVYKMRRKSTGDPIDLTGAVMTAVITDELSKEVVATVNHTVVDGPEGDAMIVITGEHSELLEPRKKYEWYTTFTIDGVKQHQYYGPVRTLQGGGT